MNIFDGMPETCSNCSRSVGLFCDACVEAYGQAFARSARREALEEAASMCEEEAKRCPSYDGGRCHRHGEAAIRALAKEKP